MVDATYYYAALFSGQLVISILIVLEDFDNHIDHIFRRHTFFGVPILYGADGN